VTGIAIVCGVGMIAGFTGGGDIVMATRTGSYYLAMIHCRRRNRSPACREGLMARTAKIGTVDVAAMFTAGGDTIVTCNTVSVCKRGMIRNSNGRRPCIGSVANVTFSGRYKMSWTFANGDHVVMTTGA